MGFLLEGPVSTWDWPACGGVLDLTGRLFPMPSVGHDTDTSALAIVGLLTTQNLARATIKAFSLQSRLLNIYQHSTVTVFTNDTHVNATSVVYTALADILGYISLPDTLCRSNLNENKFT